MCPVCTTTRGRRFVAARASTLCSRTSTSTRTTSERQREVVDVRRIELRVHPVRIAAVERGRVVVDEVPTLAELDEPGEARVTGRRQVEHVGDAERRGVDLPQRA